VGPVPRASLYLLCLGIAAGTARGYEQATQTVQLGVYVPPIVKWLGGDSHGAVASATLTVRPDASDARELEASHVFRLMMNVDVVIDARVTPFRDRRDPSDELDTYWRIVDDTDGDTTRTGVLPHHADAEHGFGAYVPTDMFLRDGLRVTHAPTDGAAKLTVTARATRPDDPTTASGAEGVYDAVITLTALPQVSATLPRRMGADRAVLSVD